MSAVIAFEGLTKRFGPVTALDGLTAEVAPGRITAFLGANGSGKTTSMRLLLGLDAPTAGTATVGGRAYSTLERPTRVVGAVVDQGFHPSRTARSHVRIVSAQAGAPRARGEAMLELVGLSDAAHRRVGGYSLGMRQRLALACALVGDPDILVLDEPFNGLDPDGIATMRSFLRDFADQGRTVFLSSHLLAEVAHSADDAVIIDHGRLVTAGPVGSLVPEVPTLLVRTPDADLLAVTLRHRGATVERRAPEELHVAGVARQVVGRTALEIGAVVLEMRSTGDDLESVFARLTARAASDT
ncbi:MAG: type transport system ATP-binding protein [Nocardioidaceae bacterium]|jgi:ABC-2 type transport system ATP-binding protein|nr:type transport system ATP-binding protein [Nocardioidaceae bacterium]